MFRALCRTLAVVLFFSATLAFAADPIDINSASAQDIAEALSGIGPSRAEAIVKYRQENGPFTSIDQLTEVKGIGAKTIENNKAMIRLGNTDKKS